MAADTQAPANLALRRQRARLPPHLLAAPTDVAQPCPMTTPVPRQPAPGHAAAAGRCPACGHGITAWQYACYPGLAKVRCRSCRLELVYPLPRRVKAWLVVAGLVAGVLPLPLLLLLPGPWLALPCYAGSVLLLSAVGGYYEARWVGRRFPPVPQGL